MTFLYPSILAALVVPLMLGIGLLLARRRTGKAWRALVSEEHPELVRQAPAWQSKLPQLLALLSLTCVIFAAARPINGYEPGEGSASGRNLIIAMDISRSMETRDVAPSRLEEARAAAYELIDALPGDKIGLIVFSGEADLVVPLTYDHTALRDALEQVNRSWAGYGGTNFEQVLRRAMDTFARSAPDGANALVILSDGEDTVDSSISVAQEAKKHDLLVITVGIGTSTGAPIPDENGENGLWEDAAGKHVISKLNIEALKRFSQATGGSFLAMNSGANLTAFARETADKLARHEESYSTGRQPRDLFEWFAFPALLMALASIVLASEWRAPRLRFVPVVALMVLGVSSGAVEAQEESPREAYARAMQTLEEQKPEEASRHFSAALLASDPRLQAAAHLALGNMHVRSTFGKLQQLYTPTDGQPEDAAQGPSVEALQGIVDELKQGLIPYQDALKAQPDFPAAKNNSAKVNELIRVLEEEIKRLKQQQQQQQQQQQDQQNQQDKQDQEQNKQDKQNQQNQQDKRDQEQQQRGQDKEQNQQDQQDKQDRQDQQDKQDQDQDKQDQGQDKQRENEDRQKDESQDRQEQQQQDQQRQDADRDQQQQEQEQAGRKDEQKDEQPQQQEQPQQDEQKAEEKQQEVQQAELSEEEKEKQRAEGILRMHLDEVEGSPIPHRNIPMRPPAKDY